MRKVCVIGHFGIGQNLLNGQTIKTKNVTQALIDEYGVDSVGTIDTHGGIAKLPIIFFKVLHASVVYKNMIMLPAHNGIKFFAPLLALLSKITSCKIYYVVIGGWLCSFLKEHKWLISKLRSFSGIYVETSLMKKELIDLGIKNVCIMPNFKYLNILRPEDLVYQYAEPFKLCTFSRVMKEKGIEDAIYAVKYVNEQLGRIAYELDIYGQIDDKYVQRFEKIKNSFPKYIRYCGMVDYDKSTELLKNYYCLLFPTRYYTEGIPGTIIDAYSAGIPVISSEWINIRDIIVENETGISFAFESVDELIDVLRDILDNKKINIMKKSALKKANDFTPENGVRAITKALS